MQTLTMLQTSVILLAIAAAGGLAMAGVRFARHVNPPAWLSMLHGLLAAAGLTLAIYAAAFAEVPAATTWGVVLLVLAAAGGAYLNLAHHWKHLLLPASIVLGHAVLAVAGFVLLAIGAFA